MRKTQRHKGAQTKDQQVLQEKERRDPAGRLVARARPSRPAATNRSIAPSAFSGSSQVMISTGSANSVECPSRERLSSSKTKVSLVWLLEILVMKLWSAVLYPAEAMAETRRNVQCCDGMRLSSIKCGSSRRNRNAPSH